MNPARGFVTRQQVLSDVEKAQSDTKLAQKSLEQKTYNRDALKKGVEEIPGLQEESKDSSLARVVDLKTEALRREIANDRAALEVLQKRAREEAAAREKALKEEEARQKKREQDEARAKAEEEKKRLARLLPEEREAELKKKAEEKKLAQEAAKRLKEEQATTPKPVAKGPVEKPNPFADQESAIAAKKDRLEGLSAVQRLLQPQPWMEDPLGTAKAQLEQAERDIPIAEEKLEEEKRTLARAEAAKQAYIDAVPGNKKGQADEAFYESFEKDISHKKARDLEMELANLRAKLKDKFPDVPVETVARCTVREQLETHISALEKEIDTRAHKAKCHKCQKENAVERSEAAKKLILAKVAELVDLAGKEGDTPDHKLARALKKIAETKDEDGATGGKMLGVLICEDGEKKPVLIWAYSGTLNPNSRGTGAELERLKRLLDAPADLHKNERDLLGTQEELVKLQKDVGAYDTAVKEIDLRVKKTNEKLQEHFDQEKKKIVDQHDAIRKEAGERQKRALDDAKEKYESAAAKKDSGFEAAKANYSEALRKASTEYQEVTNESQEGQRVSVEKLQSEVKARQEGVRRDGDRDKEAAAEKFHMDTVQELEKKKSQLLRDKAELERRVKERETQFGEDTAKLKDAIAKAGEETEAASRLDTQVENGTAPIWERSIEKELKSKSKDSELLADLNHEHEGTPHGVCSAPKMIQAAYGKNLKVISMAEAWYGGGTNTHGELVASCNTCVKNIGFQLCETTHVD